MVVAVATCFSYLGDVSCILTDGRLCRHSGGVVVKTKEGKIISVFGLVFSVYNFFGGSYLVRDVILFSNGGCNFFRE